MGFLFAPVVLLAMMVSSGSSRILNKHNESINSALCQTGDYLCPDLRSGLSRDILIGRYPQNQWWLNFTAIIGNSGDGPLEVHPTYPEDGGVVTAFQHIYPSPSSGLTEPYIHEVGILAYHPSHDHWHVNGILKIHLVRPLDPNDLTLGPDYSAEVEEDLKISFCLIDSENLLDGEDSRTFNTNGARYFGCNTPTALQGISSGFADNYPFFLQGNAIQINPQISGVYFLVQEVNWAQRFLETASNQNSDTVNDNLSWMAIDIHWDSEMRPSVTTDIGGRLYYSDTSQDSNGVDWPALAAKSTWYWPPSAGCNDCEQACCVKAYPLDIDDSGRVDLDDLSYVLVNWQRNASIFSLADINGDHRVNLDDLSAILVNWKTQYNPEPNEYDCCCVEDTEKQCLFTPRAFCTFDGFSCKEDQQQTTTKSPTTTTTTAAPSTTSAAPSGIPTASPTSA